MLVAYADFHTHYDRILKEIYVRMAVVKLVIYMEIFVKRIGIYWNVLPADTVNGLDRVER